MTHLPIVALLEAMSCKAGQSSCLSVAPCAEIHMRITWNELTISPNGLDFDEQDLVQTNDVKDICCRDRDAILFN